MCPNGETSRSGPAPALAPGAARGLRTADYAFDLPPELIAQAPLARRDASRLMVVDQAAGTIAHRTFADLPALMRAGDVLALNTTRVFRARLVGTRQNGARGEALLLRALDPAGPHGPHAYEAMVSPGGKLKPGRRLRVADDLEVEVVEVLPERRTRVVRLHTPDGDAAAAIERHGRVPLPPYIQRADDAADAERYQTVYAREAGSVAAPTAGLHMTPELLADIERCGVRRADVLLHVGAGTFKPVEVDDPAEHVMHEEWYDVPAASAALVNEARAAGGAVWALGTTTARTLESAAGGGRPDADGRVRAGAGETRLFVRPGYQFRAVDRLVTNFHLPRSTLLMLVAALAGYELTMHAYQEAVREGYRFYSYGDAMAVV